MDIKELIGETLTHIDVGQDEYKQDQIMLTTASGRTILITHDQDCCETVCIEGTDGEWSSLIGKVIVDAEHTEDQEDTPCGDSQTDTELIFKTDDATVISRWIGTSNGYYSERVKLKDLTAQRGR